MADHAGLTAWVLKRAEALRLRATRFEWTCSWLPAYTDLQVSIEVDGQRFIGRSTGRDPDHVFQVAASEALEGAIMVANGLSTSSGVAVHEELALARRNAAFELVERDWFLRHYNIGTPLGDRSEPDLPHDLATVIDRLRGIGVRFSWSRAGTSEGPWAVACVAHGDQVSPKFGLALGLGCSETAESAASAAFLECLRPVMAWCHGCLETPISWQEFRALEKIGPHEHRRLYLDPERAWDLDRILVPSNPLEESPLLDLAEIRCRDLSSAIPGILRGVPLYAVLAEAVGAQALYFGVSSCQTATNPFPHPVA